MNSKIEADIKKNRLKLSFVGTITKKEFERLYTDVRFAVADLQPGFNVISDFSECRLMYLNGLITFRKIFSYIISNESGEIVRVLAPNRLITKQIINASLMRKGYKPIYASTLEEADEIVGKVAKRDGLRFELDKQPVDIASSNKNYQGHILNISTSGCAINSSSLQPQKGDDLILKFSFTGKSSGEVFELAAKVVRSESYSFAVSFILPDRDTKNLLWRCIVDESGAEVR